MNRLQWYYARNDQQIGPVSPSEIKRLADAGDLKRDDLVWREGMEGWVPAELIKGLFEEQRLPPGESAETDSEPPEPPTGPAAAAAESNAAPQSSKTPDKASLPPAVAPGPTPRAPGSPTFEPSAARYERFRKRPSRHLFDVLLDAARSQFDPLFVDSTAKMFTICGHYGLYAAMVVLLAFGLAVAVETGAAVGAILAVVGAAILAVLQYAADRFCKALEQFSRTTEGSVSSTAIPDSLALAGMVLGLGLLLASTVAAISTGQYTIILGGLAAFIVCEHLAFVSLNPDALHVAVTPDLAAGHEALGSVVFLLKVASRVVPVVFGAGVAWGALNLLYACYWLLGSEEGIVIATGTALAAAFWTIAYAALPVVAHALLLLGYLGVATVRAILILPATVLPPDQDSRDVEHG